MTDPTAAPSGPTNDMRELYALQHAITDAGGTVAPGVHKAIDALREVWDRDLRRAQAEAHQFRTALQGAARAAVPAGQAPATDDTDLTEADVDRMMAAGTPVQIVTGPPATHGANESTSRPDQATAAGQNLTFSAPATDQAAPVDRATVLRDFLWRLEQSAGDAAAEKFLDDNPDLAALLAAASAIVVRRATDETPGPDRCSGCRYIPCGDCFEAAAQLVEGCDTDPNTRFAAEALREEAAKLRGTPSESPAVGSQQPEGAKCPRCGEDLTEYAEDDRVWRTGDDRPYCSGECVIAAHRANLPKEARP